MSQTIAVADIGGTHARFAPADIDGGKVVALGDPVTLKTEAFASFDAAWEEFGRRSGAARPRALSVSFAGPVGGEEARLTNNDWVIRPARAEKQLGVDRFTIVNDFGAVAHAVAALGEDCFAHIAGPDRPLADASGITVVEPGTGLGVAQVHRRDGKAVVIETEGGHIDFAPLDPTEDRILEYLRRQFPRVSVERLVAGEALPNLYRALAEFAAAPTPLADHEIALWKSAMNGSDPLAAAAFERFMLSLGSVAGDLALAHGADAVVIAGGLGLRLKDRFATSGFAGRFVAKGRFTERMKTLPIKLITYPQPGLYGAAVAFAAQHRAAM